MKTVQHDITGQRFGRLVALKFERKIGWHCQCDCGNKHIVKSSWQMRKGNTVSCGCYSHATYLKKVKIREDLGDRIKVGLEIFADSSMLEKIRDFKEITGHETLNGAIYKLIELGLDAYQQGTEPEYKYYQGAKHNTPWDKRSTSQEIIVTR